jgi:hypothetical protein
LASINVRQRRRLERGQQQAVVAPRKDVGQCAAGKAADAVGDQPLRFDTTDKSPSTSRPKSIAMRVTPR